MSRKDIIIISVLINTGLLAVLFITALKTNPEETLVVKEPVSYQSKEIAYTAIEKDFSSSPDEVDMVLKEYLPEIGSPVSMIKIVEEVPEKEETLTSDMHYVEVTVKSGDALEKIARANRTTVDEIRKANHLTSDKLKIGQVLRVPVGTIKPKEPKNPQKVIAEVKESPVYYVIKPGDNPWKIAKMHDVKFDDLLILNDLDEERAKNLKVGEKIRVR